MCKGIQMLIKLINIFFYKNLGFGVKCSKHWQKILHLRIIFIISIIIDSINFKNTLLMAIIFLFKRHYMSSEKSL